MPVFRSAGSGAGVSPALEAVADAAVADAAVVAACVVAAVGIADASVADGVAAVAVAAFVVAAVVAAVAVGIADASGVFVIVSTVVFADCGGISLLSGSMRRMRWRIWRPSQRNSTTSPGCRA